MGARGALKLPVHLRAVTDTETADTAAEMVPKVAPTKPQTVTDNPALSLLWDQIVPELDRTGLIAPSDAPAVELALRHFLMARVAADEVGDTVTVIDRENDARKHPAEAVFRAESEMFLKYAAQLGMTFVARARTPAAKGADDGESNPFA
ncbi:MAG: Phage terminase, small subunit [Pseudonocardiales bacterium]|nr:Phage terminase, small subunit [Pseudonocardiales bacterium]